MRSSLCRCRQQALPELPEKRQCGLAHRLPFQGVPSAPVLGAGSVDSGRSAFGSGAVFLHQNALRRCVGQKRKILWKAVGRHSDDLRHPASFHAGQRPANHSHLHSRRRHDLQIAPRDFFFHQPAFFGILHLPEDRRPDDAGQFRCRHDLRFLLRHSACLCREHRAGSCGAGGHVSAESPALCCGGDSGSPQHCCHPLYLQKAGSSALPTLR